MHRFNLKHLSAAIGVLLVTAGCLLLLNRFHTAYVADALLSQARKADADGVRDQALTYWSRYLELKPQDTDVRVELGRALARVPHAQRKRLEQAFFNLEQALTQDSSRDDVRRLLVRVTIGLQRFDKAREHLDALKKSGPPSGELSALEGEWNEAQGLYKEAANAYREAIQLAPHHLASYVRLADILRRHSKQGERANQAQEADACMDKLVATNETSAAAHLMRYHYLMDFGAADDESRLQTAAGSVKRAEELTPDDADVLLAAGKMALAYGDLERARTYSEKGLRLYPKDFRFCQAMAALDAHIGDHAKAMRDLRLGIDRLPAHGRIPLLFDLAELLIDDGQFDEAEATVRRLLELDSPPPLTDFLLGRICLRKGQWQESTRYFAQVAAAQEVPHELAKRANRYLTQDYKRPPTPTGTYNNPMPDKQMP
jgi:tetratricopeptide (TPR) repeat protein